MTVDMVRAFWTALVPGIILGSIVVRPHPLVVTAMLVAAGIALIGLQYAPLLR